MACAAPNHYLNLWWPLINRTLKNILQWKNIVKLTNFHRRSAFRDCRLRFCHHFVWKRSVKYRHNSCYLWRLTYGYLEIESHPATQNGFGNGFVSSTHFLNQIISNCMTPHGESRIQGVKFRHILYIPRNMHTVLLCFALLWLCNRS